MAQAMQAMNDPEVMANAVKMMKDPNFAKEMQAYMKDPAMKKYVEAVSILLIFIIIVNVLRPVLTILWVLNFNFMNRCSR